MDDTLLERLTITPVGNLLAQADAQVSSKFVDWIQLPDWRYATTPYSHSDQPTAQRRILAS